MLRPRPLALAALLALAWLAPARPAADPRWWRGNTHTHTLWSDGDGAPDLVADWYRRQGYHFLVLSEHNVLPVGERWFPVDAAGRLTPERVEQLVALFGAPAVPLRETAGGTELRLANLEELRARFEAPGEFLFVAGEEITDAFEGAPVHLNGLNLAELIPPRGGASVRATLANDVAAVVEAGLASGRTTLAHVNHPNFGWALTAEDLAQAGGRFFEVYNGHAGVRNAGDARHPSTERLWDLALAARLREPGGELLYGLASDDAHSYHAFGAGQHNPGRGWVMVRAAALEAEALMAAMHRGEFYASTGVTLEEVSADARGLRIDVAAEPGLTYTTRFVGTRRGEDAEIGELLLETDADPAVYAFRGDELYVRATVVSSRPHPNPQAEGDLETAWIQPVVPPQR